MPNVESQDLAPTQRVAVNSPDDGIAVVPNDGLDTHPFLASCYWVGVTGDIALMNSKGVGVVYKGVPAGAFWLAPRSKRVMATGTTATNIVACR